MNLAHFINSVNDQVAVNLNNGEISVLHPPTSSDENGHESFTFSAATFSIADDPEPNCFGLRDVNLVEIKFEQRTEWVRYAIRISDTLRGQDLYFYLFGDTLVGQDMMNRSADIAIQKSGPS